MVVLSRVITTWYQVFGALKLNWESNIVTLPTMPMRWDPEVRELPVVAPIAKP